VRPRAAGGIGAAVLLGVAYLKLIRPWTMRVGATDDELNCSLPGDDVVPDAGFSATRAITIDAPPQYVWPWLVQMGSGRAGWYAFDLLDNGGVPSAETIRADLQDVSPGDLILMIVGKDVGPRVQEITPDRRMLWSTGDEFSWEWVLAPVGVAQTRLINRIRERYPPLFSRRMLYAVVASSGDFVINSIQLRGIKRRAERLAAQASSALDTKPAVKEALS
jgi:hypothetical protein